MSPNILVEIAFAGTAGMIDINRLLFGIELPSIGTHFAGTGAGMLDTAEGQMCFSTDGGIVDMGDAGLKVLDDLEGPL